ncbi:hypothetical protein STEG23_008536 [Scotinomys teguina]
MQFHRTLLLGALSFLNLCVFYQIYESFNRKKNYVIEDAQHPGKYHMLIAMVDVIFADMAQSDQTRIVALNAHTFLRNGGYFVISIKANCIDSTALFSY